jgi:hypothetical protein
MLPNSADVVDQLKKHPLPALFETIATRSVTDCLDPERKFVWTDKWYGGE